MTEFLRKPETKTHSWSKASQEINRATLTTLYTLTHPKAVKWTGRALEATTGFCTALDGGGAVVHAVIGDYRQALIAAGSSAGFGIATALLHKGIPFVVRKSAKINHEIGGDLWQR